MVRQRSSSKGIQPAGRKDEATQQTSHINNHLPAMLHSSACRDCFLRPPILCRGAAVGDTSFRKIIIH